MSFIINKTKKIMLISLINSDDTLLFSVYQIFLIEIIFLFNIFIFLENEKVI